MSATLEQYVYGGVDSRSNPLNMPQDRFLRCRNWTPLPSGDFRLRWGYSALTMTGATNSAAIHSIVDYHLWDDTAYVIYGQGNQLKRRAADGTVTAIGGLASTNRWNTIRAKNRLYIGDGVSMRQYDGTTFRSVGIRAPNPAEAAGVSTAIGANDANGVPAAVLPAPQGGYQFYMSYYNPNTGEIGNWVEIGNRLLSSTASDYNLTGLPNLFSINPEWVKLIGRSVDGGEVPYACSDAALNWVIAANAATSVVVGDTSATGNHSNTVDFDTELPSRNGVPPNFDKFAKTSTRVYGNLPNSPYVYWSESDADDQNSTFVGVAPSSWAPNSFLTIPSGDKVTGIHGVDEEVWAGSRHEIAILTDYGTYHDWRGSWYGLGFAGQRAFCKTSYGPFWISGSKQLCTQGQNGPVTVSDEYELALLSKIGSAYLSQVECTYILDADNLLDQVVIKALDKNGVPFEVVHDFKLRDDRSPLGQGYERIYAGALAGGDYTTAQVEDADFKRRMWAGGPDGKLYWLQNGYIDGTSEFSADLIALKNAGPTLPEVPQISIVGDFNAQASYATRLNNKGLNSFAPLNKQFRIPNRDTTLPGGDQNFEYFFNIKETELKWMYVRVQLDSHSADAPASVLNDPPHVPLEWYGRIFLIRATVMGDRGGE